MSKTRTTTTGGSIPISPQDISSQVILPTRLLSDKDKTMLHTVWDASPGKTIADTFLKERHPDATAAESILLTQAVEKIRDEYYEAFNRMQQINAQRDPKNAFGAWAEAIRELRHPEEKRDLSPPAPGQRPLSPPKEKERLLALLRRQLYSEMILHNRDSMLALRSDDFGISGEKKTSLLSGTGEDTQRVYTGLNDKESWEILGKVVRNVIDTYVLSTREMEVPKTLYIPDHWGPSFPVKNLETRLKFAKRPESAVSYYDELTMHIQKNESFREKNAASWADSPETDGNRQIPPKIIAGLIDDALADLNRNAGDASKAWALSTADIHSKTQALLDERMQSSTKDTLRAYLIPPDEYAGAKDVQR